MLRHILECLESLAASGRSAERHFNRQPGLDRGIAALKDLHQAGGGVRALQLLAHKADLSCFELNQVCDVALARIDAALARVMSRLFAKGEGHGLHRREED
jgi:hypothetical protein